MNRYQEAARLLNESDFLLIGAGAGLSAAAGLTYSGARFETNFSDFIARYGLTDMYSSGFYPFETQEEKWAYWARHANVNRHDPPALDLYLAFFQLVKDKNYFVITTNVDSQFEKSGFSEDRIFEVQGNCGKLQCKSACHKKTYENRDLFAVMREQTADCRIPTALVPHCPVCGGAMEMNLRADANFVEDDSWHAARAAYEAFLQQSGTCLLMELGVGFNTPGIIRYPFELAIQKQPKWNLLRLNRDFSKGPPENAKQTISFPEPIDEVIAQLAIERKNHGSE